MTLLSSVAAVVLQAVSLSQATVPASGQHEVLLKLDAPGAIHLSARGSSGSSCEVSDRVRGPFARAGVVGTRNCELDLLLDAGEYKVRIESPKNGTGTVALAAVAFSEKNRSPVQLQVGSALEMTLKPGEQATQWFELAERQVPWVRVAGRNAGDVRLWRNGEWLEPTSLRHAVVSNTPGLPQHEWWLDSMVEAGQYQLVVYGRDAAVSPSGLEDDSLTIERGFRPAPPERSMQFKLPAAGLLALELPTIPTAAFVSLRQAPSATVSLQVAQLAEAIQSEASCSIVKGAVAPECGARAEHSARSRRVLFLRGPRGTAGTLEWANSVGPNLGQISSWRGGYYGAATSSFSFATSALNNALIAVHDLPLDLDAAPLGCQLETSQGVPIARAMTHLGPGEGLDQDFNADEGSVIWFSLGASNRYRIKTGGERKSRCELYRFKKDGALERLTTTNANDAPGCDRVLSLGAGEYQLQLLGGTPGIEHLTVREEGPTTFKRVQGRSSCTLPAQALGVGGYRLTFTRVGALTARGLAAIELPADPSSEPLHLTLEPKATLTLPLARHSNFAIASAGGTPFDCVIPGAPPVTTADCKVPGGDRGETLVVSNPSEKPVALLLSKSAATPNLSAPTAFSPAATPLPRLVPERASWFDFDRAQTQVGLFEVDAPGLYNVTTLGLLATSCRLRTPVNPEVATDRSGGRGRNCLMQNYLQKGRYLLSATTEGPSRGRGALFVMKRPVKAVAAMGVGESFFRVDANELVQQKLTIPKDGLFTLSTSAQGARLSCRLDDAEGWPLEAVPAPCSGARLLRAGTVSWTQLPLTVESMRRTAVARVQDPVVLRGNRPHPIVAFTWYDAELGSDGRDEFTFTLEGEATLDLVLTQAMQGRIFRLEKDQAPKAVEVVPPQLQAEGEDTSEEERSYDEENSDGETEVGMPSRQVDAPPPPSGARVTLPAGSYKLVTEHSRGDVGISYRLHFGSAVLLAGMSRSVPVPSTLQLAVPREGTLRIKTEGEADVRCRVFDEDGKLVVEGRDNGADWNCAIAEPMAKGRYTLVLESETQLPGETRLSTALPPVEAAGTFTSGQKVNLGSGVTQLALPEGDSISELTVKSARPFSCAFVGPQGVSRRLSRVTDCSVSVLTRSEPWFLRLWTTDGSTTVTTELTTRAPTEVTIQRAGRYRTADKVQCLSGSRAGVLSACAPEVSLEAGSVVFSAAIAPEELRVAATGAAEPQSLGRRANLQTLTATEPSLFLLSARTGWGEAAPPACAFDGVALTERQATSCFAVSQVGREALARTWAASDVPVPTTVTRQAVALPSTTTALTPGRKRVSFTGVGVFTVPAPRARVEITAAEATWAVLLDERSAPVDFCAPTTGLRYCVLTGQGGKLVLVGAGEAELTTVVLESAPSRVAFTGLYEDAPRSSGTVRLTIPAGDARSLVIEGATRCTLSLSTGERLTDCRTKLPAKTAAELVVEHEVAPLRVIASTPGRERWARLGLELPSSQSVALAPALAVPLQQGRVDRTLTLTESAVVRVSAESGVCGLFRGNDLLAVDGADTGCELVRVLNPGTYRLLVRPFANRAQTASVRWLAEPVTVLSEGIAAEAWLAPGEARLFTFDTKAKGRVGLGLQARSETLDCSVFNDGYQALGEGCHQYLALEKGRFLFMVRNPSRPGGAPIAVKPVVLGLAGDAAPVPPEYLQDLFRRVGTP